MSWLDDTLRDFGSRIGVGELAFGPGGFVQFALSEGGMLGLAQAEGEVRVWLARPLARGDRGALERALVQCDFRRRSPFALQAGLRGEDELVLLARIPEREFTTPALERVLELLTTLHARARSG